jgi:ABC-type sugar transport system permease subunit
MVLLSMVYTVTDLFARHSMPGIQTARVARPTDQVGLLEYIRFIGFTNGNYGVASAMASMYVLATLVVVAIVTFLISRVVFYYD